NPAYHISSAEWRAGSGRCSDLTFNLANNRSASVPRGITSGCSTAKGHCREPAMLRFGTWTIVERQAAAAYRRGTCVPFEHTPYCLRRLVFRCLFSRTYSPLYRLLHWQAFTAPRASSPV